MPRTDTHRPVTGLFRVREGVIAVFLELLCQWLTTRDATLKYTPTGTDPAPGANLFVGELPTVPPAKPPVGYIVPAATVAAMWVYGGAAPSGTLDDPLSLERPRFQVLTRGPTQSETSALAYRLMGLLGRVSNSYIGGGMSALRIRPVQSPLFLEMEGTRPIFVTNYDVLKPL